MAKVTKKPRVIEAFQLVRGEPWPQGVHGENGEMYVITIQGVKTPITYGEWVMPEGDGVHFYPCANDVFLNTYHFVEED